MKPSFSAPITRSARTTLFTRSLRCATLCVLGLLSAAASNADNSPVGGNGNIWRCEQAGKVSYSTTPCPTARNARALETLEPRNSADVREAQQRAAQERKAADALTREREAREARESRQLAMQTRPANLGPEKARPAAPKAEKTAARESRRHSKRSLKKAPAGETWRAVAPRSRRTRG